MLNKQIQRESKSEVISVWEEVEEGVTACWIVSGVKKFWK